ncbi:hypothetical protein [Streptomyces sp. NPDC087294]|uniref:hypothetical protein n=1 Tax=Streptomyces sp. NPDC087294 TaxID=3365777 RepID=UPI0037F24777
MADEQYRWLDRATAEILLRGESLEPVPADTRDQAERLARTLEALTAEPVKPDVELPGEAAALAAFRAARATASRPAPPHPSDAGPIRIDGPERNSGRPRWSRPVRFGLTAVLAVGMAGGAAVAATSGVLPAPFDDAPSRPVASASVASTPQRPLLSPSSRSALPEPTSGVPTSRAPHGDTRGTPSPGGDRAAGQWDGALSACRDVRAGKELSADRRRALKDAAGGTGRVRTYCTSLAADPTTTGRGRTGTDGGTRADRQTDQSDDEGHHITPGSKGSKGSKGIKGDVGDGGSKGGKSSKSAQGGEERESGEGGNGGDGGDRGGAGRDRGGRARAG